MRPLVCAWFGKNCEMALLRIEKLSVHFTMRRGLFTKARAGGVRAVDGVSLEVQPGEVLGLVGESGCGKTTLARAVVRLAPITDGRVFFEDVDLSALRPHELLAMRPRLQMIFQDPYASLNPRMTVYDTLAEPLLIHRVVERGQITAAVNALMERVGLARRFVRKYPHEFSGGQRQRIAIARALSMRPSLILADEPVSALDVSVQAQILNLLSELCRDSGLTLVLVSHDLAVVGYLASRIAVMYLGRIVEEGPAAEVLSKPRHPYTCALLAAAPLPDPDRQAEKLHAALRGEPPSPMNPPSGCPFHPRCPHAMTRCTEELPELDMVHCGWRAACHLRDHVEEKLR